MAKNEGQLLDSELARQAGRTGEDSSVYLSISIFRAVDFERTFPFGSLKARGDIGHMGGRDRALAMRVVCDALGASCTRKQ